MTIPILSILISQIADLPLFIFSWSAKPQIEINGVAEALRLSYWFTSSLSQHIQIPTASVLYYKIHTPQSDSTQCAVCKWCSNFKETPMRSPIDFHFNTGQFFFFFFLGGFFNTSRSSLHTTDFTHVFKIRNGINRNVLMFPHSYYTSNHALFVYSQLTVWERRAAVENRRIPKSK